MSQLLTARRARLEAQLAKLDESIGLLDSINESLNELGKKQPVVITWTMTFAPNSTYSYMARRVESNGRWYLTGRDGKAYTLEELVAEYLMSPCCSDIKLATKFKRVK